MKEWLKKYDLRIANMIEAVERVESTERGKHV